MSDEVVQPAADEPAAAPPPEPASEPATPPPPADEDAALETALDEQAIDIPDGDKLVPLSAVTSLRGKIKDYKAQLSDASTKASKAAELESKVAQLEAQLQQLTPYAQAYLQAQQQPREEPKESPEDVAELKAIAEDLDLYRDGQLDLDRARRVRDRQQQVAERIARQQVEPMRQQSVKQQSDAMLVKAMNTAAPSGMKPDPAMLKAVWSRLDPSVTATQEGAIQAWTVAMGYTSAVAPAAKRETTPPPEPLFTEKAGGRASASVTLTDQDKRTAKELGYTEAEYAKEVAKMPWGRR